MRAQDDVDPAVLARDVGKLNSVLSLGGTGLPKTQHTIKQSASTVQRCKTITMYIKKLQDDISMLTDMKDSLGEVRHQLEKEKIDTFIAERISKEALAAFKHMEEGDFMQKLLDDIAHSRNGLPEVQSGMDFDTTGEVNLDFIDDEDGAGDGGEESLLEGMRRGMEEPPLAPPPEEDFVATHPIEDLEYQEHSMMDFHSDLYFDIEDLD